MKLFILTLLFTVQVQAVTANTESFTTKQETATTQVRDLHDIQAPNAGGDSVSEVLGDAKNFEECDANISKMEFLTTEEEEKAYDQCADQAY